MLLTKFIKHALAPKDTTSERVVTDDADSRMRVLNVGGGSKQIPIPSHYNGWKHCLLDIAPGDDVDVVLDARRLLELDAAQFDAVYCSHNLEHYYVHDVPKVLTGFFHVLKSGGYAEIRVPDVAAVMARIVIDKMELDDVLYVSANGPISAHDVIYGWGKEIERSGVDFYAHKRGFSEKSLRDALVQAGFPHIVTYLPEGAFEVRAVAFKEEPTPTQRATFMVGSSP